MPSDRKKKPAYPKFSRVSFACCRRELVWGTANRPRPEGRARGSPTQRESKLASAPTPELAPSTASPAPRPAPEPTAAPAAARPANFPPSPGGRSPAPLGVRVPLPRAGGWGRGRRLRLTRRAARTKRRPRRR